MPGRTRSLDPRDFDPSTHPNDPDLLEAAGCGCCPGEYRNDLWADPVEAAFHAEAERERRASRNAFIHGALGALGLGLIIATVTVLTMWAWNAGPAAAFGLPAWGLSEAAGTVALAIIATFLVSRVSRL